MGFIRAIICIVLPPLAVLDKGCGSFLIVLLLTLCGWVPGVLAAILICLSSGKGQKYGRHSYIVPISIWQARRLLLRVPEALPFELSATKKQLSYLWNLGVRDEIALAQLKRDQASWLIDGAKRASYWSGVLMAGFLVLVLVGTATFFLRQNFYQENKSISKSEHPAQENQTNTTSTSPATATESKSGRPALEIPHNEPLRPVDLPSAKEFYDHLGLKAKGFDFIASSHNGSFEWTCKSKLATRNYSITLRGSPQLEEISGTVLGNSKEDAENASRTFFATLCKPVTDETNLKLVTEWINQNIGHSAVSDFGHQSFQIYTNHPQVRTIVIKRKP